MRGEEVTVVAWNEEAATTTVVVLGLHGDGVAVILG